MGTCEVGRRILQWKGCGVVEITRIDGRDMKEIRQDFPATARVAYFDTAAVGLASRNLIDTYRRVLTSWEFSGFDFIASERAASTARRAVSKLMGASSDDVALIPSISAAAGLVAAQLGPAKVGDNVVIGAREYSSNHFPWRQLAAKGYDVRQVPFRGGGLEPQDVAERIDARTRVVAFSAVQAATGHRSDIPAISALAHAVDALVFVDASQLVGALPIAGDLPHVDVLATADHKFLMHAGRGMGYCYISRSVQSQFVAVNAGWRAARVPLESFFGPDMELSSTASRFDSSISWLAARGNAAALESFDEYGANNVFSRNRALTTTLRIALTDVGWEPTLLRENESTIVSVPLHGKERAHLREQLRERDIACSVRDEHLRLAVHFYNDESDIDRLCAALSVIGRRY